MTTQYRQTWDLESIFSGGSQSPELAQHLSEAEETLRSLLDRVAALPEPASEEARDQWYQVTEDLATGLDRLYQGAAFLGCLIAQNVKDMEAKIKSGRSQQAGALFGNIVIAIQEKLLHMSDEAWGALKADPRFKPLAFNLQELRDQAADQMDKARETLVTDLSVDGYHAWGRLYSTVVGRVTVPVDGQDLSAGQAYNKFSNPDPAFRTQLFKTWEEAWGKEAELCAAALNNLAGFRLAMYKHRGWDSILHEPLVNNRMTEATLNAMWAAVAGGKAKLVQYMNRKARLLGQERLNWYDEMAPLSAGNRSVSYDEGARFILDQFGRFSPRMAQFAERAFEGCWIESEDRPGKMPGGFCTPLPLSRQCRIFLTFGGEANSVATLAHELGHAYHFDVMWDISPLARNYAMNVAETASTFAEMITARAAVAAAPTREEKLSLLDSSLQRAVAMFMNIHARFLFETRFYERRRKGLVGVDQLNELMVQAQKDAFLDSLGTYHPLFWAAKGHFYGTGSPFYNFPYTFGMLFAAGVYARAVDQGAAFEQKYVDLLRDTGRMTVEDLARRHLDADLTQAEFWEAGVKVILSEADEFLSLTEQ